ncbi:amylo-alpha-1,6-glucosidase [Paenibacillus rhizovicinus]|uniref:Amylo-alpha-1,6-glucosidase n=1 Tax=Paenibacillus rhizovicinus TaxID=2704463 RepID=A0A6C0P5P4_9BACL|nr:amylo-alpha-1,6-glucosidase [Paenibacillus rhizovicinus]QHW33775.1 amylo-alpha-1,6-glucosidase [Paenibacillus rhizovicinus]
MDYRVIKENDLFLLTDQSGNIPEHQEQGDGFGLYMQDTRFLSRMELLINGKKPIVLASEADQNFLSTILLTNPHMEENGVLTLWRESIELKRTRYIYKDVLYETIQATNYSPYACSFELSLRIDADFADMFVVRGFMHGELGKPRGRRIQGGAMQLGYDGADGMIRELKIGWPKDAGSVKPDGTICFPITLDAAQSASIPFHYMPIVNGAEPKLYPRTEALNTLQAEYDNWLGTSTTLDSDMPLMNDLYNRGMLDLRVLMTDLGFGMFPVAGLPWFAVPFGRDSLITALQMLPVRPEIALGTLRTMAHHQGVKLDAWHDEQPGKIMHELRKGELSNTNQVPFSPYFGTIDATPLFLVLLGEYVKWTGDYRALKELMPNALRALDWIDEYGHREGGKFVAYFQESSKGIANQGWKDSADSVVHRDGSYAKAPIALIEVQGYVYQAKRALAGLFAVMAEREGDGEYAYGALGKKLEADAEALRTRFEADFWMAEENYYAIALDRENKRVESVTSNPGHALMSGLFAPERAAAVAKRLVAPDMFGGYGIRTMAEGQTGYNPMSYHDGSIWPHDNSMCLMGLSAQGFRQEAAVVIEGLLEASKKFENNRLPELFCGYSAVHGRPVSYPVACSPQAWAAGTPLVFMTSMLGLSLDLEAKTIRLNPVLPRGMNRLRIGNMRIGEGLISVQVERDGDGYRTKVDGSGTTWKVELPNGAKAAAEESARAMSGGAMK